MIRSPEHRRDKCGVRLSIRAFPRPLPRRPGARKPVPRQDVLAALREHVYLTVMLGYERDDGTMTELYKGVLVEASRTPAPGKADRFALVTRPAANVWHLPPACSPK